MNTQLHRTILIVEDSPEDRELYRRYLIHDRDYDYTIVEASLGEEGLNLWHQHQPDAMLLDYRLPDLDGLEFLAALQTQKSQTPLPIVMVTGAGSETIAAQAIKAGAQDYLVKGQITSEGLKLALDATIKTVQLQTQLQECIDRERVVAQIAQKVLRSLDLNEILQTTVTEVRQFLQTDRVVVFQVEPDSNGRVVAESVGAEWRSILAEQIYDPCFAESYVDLQRQGRVTVKADIYDGSIDPCHVQLLAGLQVRANLVVPILHDDQFWGVLIAHHCAAPRQWRSLDIDLLQQLSTQVSVAIRQAELYQQAQDELAERKRTEEVLRDSEERLRLGLQAARMGTWDWNIPENRFIWSANMEALFGLAPGEFDGSYEQFVARLHPDDRDRVLKAINAAMTPGANYDIEFRVLYPDGTIRWALSQGKVFYDAIGQPIRMSGVDLDISDRKRTGEALQESETRFRQLAENIDAVFWLREEPEGRVAYVSSAYERLWGWQPQELYENHSFWFDHIHPDDREWTYQAFQSKAAAGQFDEDYRIVLDDGRIRWVNDRCFPLYDQTGRLYRFAGIAEDITDRKLIEESLRQSEEFRKRVLESSSDCIKVLDLDAQLLYMNAGGICLLEIDDLTPYLNSEWLCFWEGDHRQAAEAAFTAAKSGEVGKFQGFCPTVKGKPKWWDVVVTPIRDGAGQVVQVLSTARDVTERKRTEEELRQKNAILDVINESAPTPIFVKDRQGRIIYANPATLAALGKTAAEVIGYSDGDLYPSPEDARRVMENDQRIMASGQMEVVEESPDGIHIFLGMKAPYYNEAGEVIGLVGISNDITDRVQLERDRERILQQKQAALAESERVNRIKDEFLAVLSHELRSPLNPILGWTKLLQTRKLDEPKTAEALATIERNAKAQCQLIDDLLDMARVLRGKLSLNMAPVDLLLVIESAIDTVQTAAIVKSIQIHAVLSDIRQVSGDAVRLQQIIWNLLTNAVKFTPSGGRIDIRLEQIDNQAQITITDTGKGISPDFLPHIFESFRQEDASVTRNHGGLGLGMAIVYQLVEAHGGTVTADSPGEGKGATFTVRLPLLNVNSKKNQSSPSREQNLDLTSIRVLVIDDEPDSRELLAVMLTQAGAEVMSVASAAEFLAALESFQPDVAVSDIGMPEVDGYTLLRQVRSLSLEQGGQVPAIALTAYAGEIDRQHAIAAGFQKHIAKPIEPDQLVVAIVSLLSGRSLP
ncbi:PAS domain S-box protein [Phormidesmis priestleyi]|uniref:PAS domain S-box protein n=1 Tax=Phormidesmis priestleyi TaxID=268141 RepID=UPI00083AD6FA|nr:PAS domain S-box protein [Phormidesmis priestleyi]